MPNFTKEDLKNLVAEIEKVDEQLDEASGSEAAAKQRISKALVEDTKTQWEKLVANLFRDVNKIEDVRVRAGVVTAVRQNLRAEFGKQVDEFVTSQLPTRDPNAPKVPDEEVRRLNNQSAELRKKAATLRELLEMFDEDVSDIPVPKKRTGSRGKRGPRVLVGYQFYVDGKERAESTNNLSSIANTVGGPEITNTQQLRDFISSKGLDLENPPKTFEVTLPNGKVLKAEFKQEMADAEAAVEEEEEEEEEEVEAE